MAPVPWQQGEEQGWILAPLSPPFLCRGAVRLLDSDLRTGPSSSFQLPDFSLFHAGAVPAAGFHSWRKELFPGEGELPQEEGGVCLKQRSDNANLWSWWGLGRKCQTRTIPGDRTNPSSS